MSLTTLPPRFCRIGKEEIGGNRTSAFSERPGFPKSFKYQGLFSSPYR